MLSSQLRVCTCLAKLTSADLQVRDEQQIGSARNRIEELVTAWELDTDAASTEQALKRGERLLRKEAFDLKHVDAQRTRYATEKADLTQRRQALQVSLAVRHSLATDLQGAQAVPP